MQKVLDFLERHVQWVAIALGALILVLALKSYLPGVAQPVAVEIAPGEIVGPGEVDKKILDQAEALDTKINATGSVSIKVPDYLKAYRESLSKPVPTSKLPALLVSSLPVEYPPNIEFVQQGDPSRPDSNKVAELPTLPPVTYDTPATTDFAQVTMPAAQGQPAAAPGAAATAAGAAAFDVVWVRVPFTLPAGNIAKAFQNVNIPANLTLTSVLQIELIRQKELPGDAWGPEEVVALLPFAAQPAYPGEGQENLNAQQQYTGWANANQPQIIQPDFFTVAAGSDPRFDKPVAAAADGVAAAGFDPETFPPNGNLDGLTPEQKDAVMKVRQRKAKEAADAKPRPTGGEGGGGRGPRPGPGGGGGGGGGRGGRSTPPTPVLPPPGGGIVPFQLGPDGGLGAAGMTPPGYPGGYPGMDGGMYPGTAAAPGAPTQIVFTPAPNPGPWQPSAIPNGTVDGWAYDVTATPDSTYRYRVRYKLKNPIFGMQNVATKAAIVAQYTLVGEDPKAWTPPIEIAPLTNIYLSTLPQPGSGRVALTIFRWQNGKRHRLSNYIVYPGDSIGKIESDIDYRTRWTLVETRRDGSSPNPYTVIMNADGNLKRLDYDLDRATPLYSQLNLEVDGPPVAPPPAPGYPGGPGGYPGRPGGRPGGGAADGGVMP